MSGNWETTYSSDCCGSPVHSDAELCTRCGEHCEVIEETVDFEEEWDGQPDLYTEAQDLWGGDDNPADYCDFFQEI